MISRRKTEGKTLDVTRIRRKQKRKRRRLVEANDIDWARWDAAAIMCGIPFTELARRALEAATNAVEARDQQQFHALFERAAAALAEKSK